MRHLFQDTFGRIMESSPIRGFDDRNESERRGLRVVFGVEEETRTARSSSPTRRTERPVILASASHFPAGDPVFPRSILAPRLVVIATLEQGISSLMITALLLLSLLPSVAISSFCGETAIPFSFQVNSHFHLQKSGRTRMFCRLLDRAHSQYWDARGRPASGGRGRANGCRRQSPHSFTASTARKTDTSGGESASIKSFCNLRDFFQVRWCTSGRGRLCCHAQHALHSTDLGELREILSTRQDKLVEKDSDHG